MKTGDVRLHAAERRFDFYRTNYEILADLPFALHTLKPTDPVDQVGRVQEIGKASKEPRDQYLLACTDSLLRDYYKIFVFGGWHLLTCQPGLAAIINKQGR